MADGVLQSIKMASREVMACTNRPDVPLIHSANDPYGTALNGNGQWIVSPQDPLFSAVPELLPPDAGCVGVSI